MIWTVAYADRLEVEDIFLDQELLLCLYYIARA